METQRLKNIIILILALLNLFLLVLLLHFRWQQTISQQQLHQRIYALYEAEGIGLSGEESLSLDAAAPLSMTLQRSLEQEAAMAAALLEEDVPAQHQGGGIYTYTGAKGTLTFRSNGAFDFVPGSTPIPFSDEFCQTFCQRFGYAIDESRMKGSTGTVSALRMVNNTTVCNAALTFLWEDGVLRSLSGTCLSTSESTAAEEKQFSAADALVKFLDYRKLTGAVCSAVTGVERVYYFHTTAQGSSLDARWQVSTDTYAYYVTCATGDVSRA